MANNTKKLLGDTLKTLMTKKSLKKITIRELVDAANVNRQTFYYHFHDIYDLLSWIYQVEAINDISNITYDTWPEEISLIVNYLYENKNFCYASYRSLGKESLERFLLRVIDALSERVMSGVAESEKLSPEDRFFIIRLYGHSLSGSLQDWVASKFAISPEQMSHQIVRSIKGTLAQMVQRFLTNP